MNKEDIIELLTKYEALKDKAGTVLKQENRFLNFDVDYIELDYEDENNIIVHVTEYCMGWHDRNSHLIKIPKLLEK